MQSILYNIGMNKQIIKAIIGAKQKEIGGLQLLDRENQFEQNSNYVLVGIRRAGKLGGRSLHEDLPNRNIV